MAAVYHNDSVDIELESGTVFRSFLNHTIGSGDNNANWYGVRVFRNGEPVNLTGCSVQGIFMPSSGSAILISDSTHTWVSENEAAVLLPQACYNVKGQFTLAIKIIGTTAYTTTGTVRIIDGVVADTYSANPVAPTAAVPTYQEILAVYDQMVAAKDGSVRFDIEQELTAAQMTQARGNIAAASESDVSDLNSALSIKFSDLNLAGGCAYNAYDPYIADPEHAGPPRFVVFHNNDITLPWVRSPFVRVYPGMNLHIKMAVHIIYFSEANYIDVVEGQIITSIPSRQEYVTKIVPNNAKYAVFLFTESIATPHSPDDVICEIDGYATKYSEESVFVYPNDGKLASSFIGLSEQTERYTSSGLKAVACDELERGIVFPYDGNIFYSENRTEISFVPFAVANNGNYFGHACSMLLGINHGRNTGTISIQSSPSTYRNISIDFENAFQGNTNGRRVTVKNNTLIMEYIYEGEIVKNTADLSEYPSIQFIYDHMVPVTGCTIQTGTSPNISYYGQGFVDYDEYYRFVKDLADDSQIADHSVRIAALEEGGGGGGGTPSELDWGKGYDLLEFGQEYLYAWLNALNSNAEFKVLFTGDSTTGYYNGTANGLKEIFQSCMTKAGFSNGTYVNRAISGINATTWVNSYLAGDIAEAPTLYIIRHGFNNDAGETEAEMAANFRTQMVTALERIRASLPVNQCSIILMTPNTSDDDANHRGQSMKKLLDPIVRQLARTYGCGFIDTFRTWYDPGQYADPMYDNPYGDGRSIHPNGLMNRVIVSKLFNFAVPLAYRNYAIGQ